ncbi:replication-relaxation family protein [Streptomyces halobius]|uniref:Replication-relaxation family protein n=1 Tax=Streptomyces halobius TaxID=2879846 RepID=A0ABY4MIA1_9ACTN|nr:replication-relaxation family protein [Streptomyces halobius]UQA97534.1 replication-relaxation family protein [Streptomyces halobius]
MPYPHPVPAGVSVTGQHALDALYQHRLVSTGQLHRLITPQNTSSEYLRRQLQSLRSDGLADCVNRRRHGQSELLWWLTENGAEAVEATGLLAKRPYRMSRQAAAGPLQEHTLATVETGTAFVTHAARLGHECGPLDWTPEIAHYYRAEDRPGEELSLIPDAVLHYVHTEADRRTLLTFFIEVDRAQMTVGRLAQKLHAYAAYHAYAPQPATRAARTTTAKPQLAWRSRYPLYPRVLLVLTGATSARLQSRINDLRSLAAADPRLPTAGIKAGITTLDELRDRGPFAPIVTPVLGPATPTDVWLAPTTAPAATAA